MLACIHCAINLQVLEMYHAAGAWRALLTAPGCDITAQLSRDQYRQLREAMVRRTCTCTGTCTGTGTCTCFVLECYSKVSPTVTFRQVSMVLATDMKYHFEHLGRLKTRLMSDAFVTVDRKDVLFLLGQARALHAMRCMRNVYVVRCTRTANVHCPCMVALSLPRQAVHAADISNPAKVQTLQSRWTQKVMKEFFWQGDLEASLGLPVSAFFNRHTTSVAQCQIGFINIIIRPFYVEVRKLLGDECQVCLDELDLNLQAWETEGNALIEEWDLSAPEGASLGFS